MKYLEEHWVIRKCLIHDGGRQPLVSVSFFLLLGHSPLPEDSLTVALVSALFLRPEL